MSSLDCGNYDGCGGANLDFPARPIPTFCDGDLTPRLFFLNLDPTLEAVMQPFPSLDEFSLFQKFTGVIFLLADYVLYQNFLYSLNICIELSVLTEYFVLQYPCWLIFCTELSLLTEVPEASLTEVTEASLLAE